MLRLAKRLQSRLLQVSFDLVINEDRSTTRPLLLILTVAFLTRIVLILVCETYATARVWEHETLANNLLAGNGYSFLHLNTIHKSFATPLFAFLCAGVYAVTNHSHFAVLVMQSLFSIALALTIFSLARRVFSGQVALLASAAVAFHPGFVYYDVFNLMPLSLDTFLIAFVVLLILKARERFSIKLMLALGFIIGLAVLSRGISGVLLPAAVIYLLFFVRDISVPQRLKSAVCIVAATLVVLSPWLVRNYVLHKQVLISSTTGELLWRGNNSRATGTLYDQNRTKIFNLWPEDFKNQVCSMTELQQRQFFEDEAAQFIRQNPGVALGLYFRKAFYFWWFSPQSGLLYPRSYLAVYKVFYSAVLLFAITGAALGLRSPDRNRREATVILIGIVLVICLAQSVFYVEGRHRWLVEPLMLIFTAHGSLTAWAWIVERRRGM